MKEKRVYSDLIRASFENVLKDLSDKNSLNLQEIPQAHYKEIQNDFRKKYLWTPGKKWSDEELKSMVKVVYKQEPLETIKEKENTNKSQISAEVINKDNEKNVKFGILSLDSNDIDVDDVSIDEIIEDSNINLLIELQNNLTNLTNDKLDEMIFFLTSNYFFSSYQNFQKLIKEIISIIPIRIKNAQTYIHLIETIISKICIIDISLSNSLVDNPIHKQIDAILLEILTRPLYSDDFDFLMNIPSLYLLKRLYNDKIYTSKQIANAFQDIINQFPVKTNFQNLFFFYFTNAIEESLPDLAQRIATRIEASSWYSSTIFENILTDFFSFKQNNWDLLDNITKNGFIKSSVEEIIFNDDIEKLKMLNSNEIRQNAKLAFFPTYSFLCLSRMNTIEFAALCGSEKCFDYIVKDDDDIKEYAICSGNEEMIKKCKDIIKKNLFKKDFNGIKNDIKASIVFRKVPIFDALFHKNYANEILCFCCFYNFSHGVYKCLENEANINYRSTTFSLQSPIHLSCHNGNTSLLSFILSIPALKVDATDNKGNTALHIAAKKNHSQIVSILLKSGLNPNIKNSAGQTALHEAAKEGCIDVVRKLINFQGVDINIKDNNGNSPISLARLNCQKVVHSYMLAQQSIETDLSERKIFIHKKVNSIPDDLSKSDISTDDLSQDFSIENFLISDISSESVL